MAEPEPRAGILEAPLLEKGKDLWMYPLKPRDLSPLEDQKWRTRVPGPPQPVPWVAEEDSVARTGAMSHRHV